MRVNTAALSMTRDTGTCGSGSPLPKKHRRAGEIAGIVPLGARRSDQAARENNQRAESRGVPHGKLRRQTRALREPEQDDARAGDAGGLHVRDDRFEICNADERLGSFRAMSAMKLSGYQVRPAAAGARYVRSGRSSRGTRSRMFSGPALRPCTMITVTGAWPSGAPAATIGCPACGSSSGAACASTFSGTPPPAGSLRLNGRYCSSHGGSFKSRPSAVTSSSVVKPG